jgi:thiol-disulfide isomerase/thioredoxin
MLKNKTIKNILTLVILGLFVQINAAELKEYKGNITNPVVNLTDLQGNLQTLDKYKNSAVLVQFWATYCPPCIKEMPSMNNLQNKLKKAGVDFKILAINMAESKEEVEEFAKKVNPEFSILLDEDGSSINDWQVFAAPSNFLIDKNGEIKYTLFGGVEWDSIEIINKITELAKR